MSTLKRPGVRPPTPAPAQIRGTGAVFLLFFAAAGYYFSWRVTIVNWHVWWVGIPLLLAELFSLLNVAALLYTAWPRPAPLLTPSDDPASFPLFFLIPTVNEGVGVLEPTIQGALAARARYLEDHPHARITVVVCNDGRVGGAKDWPDVEALAARLGVQCVTRTQSGGAKAGNIEFARQTVGATGDALLALFDADMVAEPEFLVKTLPPFADPSVGWVQTGQYYRNQGSAVARWAHDQQTLFYKLVCIGKAAVNGAFICGTNVVVRAAALDSIGGLPQNTVTEDLAASILLHPRWRSFYVADVLALGLGPEDLGAYFSQQRRWALGTFAVLFRHWRELLLPRRGGLTGPQRLQYLYCCGHFFSGFRDLACLAAPLAYLCLGVSAFQVFRLPDFLRHFLPYWILSLFAFWYVTRGLASFRAVLHGSILSFGCFPTFLTAFVSALIKKRVRFVITAKKRQAGGRQHLVPQALLLALCVFGLGRFAEAGSRGWLGVICEVWTLYLALLLAGMLWLGAAENPATERKMARANACLRPAYVVIAIIAAVLLFSHPLLGRLQAGPRPVHSSKTLK